MNDGRRDPVEHVKRTEAGPDQTDRKLPISLRAGMAALSKRLGISQLAIVRSALGYLLANAEPVTAMAVPPEVTPLPALETAPEAPVEAIAEAQTEAQAEEATEAQPEVQTPAPPPQAATGANAARAARHRSKLLSRKPTKTRKRQAIEFLTRHYQPRETQR